MFTNIASGEAKMVSVHFDGRAVQLREGLSVAAALLEAGIVHFRDTPVMGSARAPFCMMGVCFDCLLIIDGMADRQSCMIEVQDGMRIERQSGAADVIGESGSATKALT
jgi:predicted molibdopterin-dependent oxidoreductase YjgC